MVVRIIHFRAFIARFAVFASRHNSFGFRGLGSGEVHAFRGDACSMQAE